MFKFTRKQKISVPNSLALAAAAVLVWSANGSTGQIDEFEDRCNSESVSVSHRQDERALPSMWSAESQCKFDPEQQRQSMQIDGSVVTTMQSASLHLLLLPAKALIRQ